MLLDESLARGGSVVVIMDEQVVQVVGAVMTSRGTSGPLLSFEGEGS